MSPEAHRPAIAAAPPLLAARGIAAAFGPVQVLHDIDFDIRPGEIHALVGENGAGKSTLMKILAGQLRPSAGGLAIDGRPVVLSGIGDAQARGIVLIHQELALATHLSVEANIFLGREVRRGPFLDRAAMRDRAGAVLRDLGCRIDPAAGIASLSVAERQMVEIAKAVSRDARLLIMDEPTAVLTGAETAALVRFIRRLQDQGVAIAYISHKLDEVLALAGRVTVLRDGRLVTTRPAAGLDPQALAGLMIGREIADVFPPPVPPPPDAPVLLEVEGLDVPGRVHGLSFHLRAGEILGLAGLVGAGRTEAMEGLAGLRPAAAAIRRDGRPVRIRTARDAVRAGIAYLTEDRKGLGLLLRQPARPNLTLANLGRYGRVFVDEAAEDAALAGAVAAFDIRAGDLAAPVATFSGGNQQKLLLAKTMQTMPRVLIVDEPTRGIDIGTKQQIYRFLHSLAGQGVGILLVSSELAEVIGLSHRVAVMREGRLAGMLEGPDINEETIMRHATGLAGPADG